MPNFTTLFKEEISKIVRKEVQEQTRDLAKTVREQRAALARLEKQAGSAKPKAAAKPTATKPAPAKPTASKASAGDKRKQLRISPDTIKKHRKRLKLSQAELAELLNVSTNTVLRWEAGSSKPRSAHLPALDKLRTTSLRDLAETEPTEAEPTATEPAEAEPAATEPTEPTETEPTEPTETEPTATKPAETKPKAKASKASAGDKRKQPRISPDTIKKHRKRLKLSQAELGEMLNVSTNTVLRWEAGSSKPRGAHLPALYKLRNLSMRDLKKQRGE